MHRKKRRIKRDAETWQTEKEGDTLRKTKTNEPNAAALIRAQGQQIRQETTWDYLQRRCGLRGDADGQEHIERVCRYERGD